MNVFTSSLSKLTFKDVVAFCDQRVKEAVNLDYKRDLSSGTLQNTVAALANTHGGVIVIGVDADKDGVPVHPAAGMPVAKGMEDVVWQKLGDSIYPPITPEFALIEDTGKCFIVLRIRESEIAPHYILQTNRIYIRSGAVNAPAHDEEAALSRIEWMLNRRAKAEEFRQQLENRMNAHFTNVVNMRGVGKSFPLLKVWFVPRYPRERLAALEALEPLMARIKVKTKASGEFPVASSNWTLGQDCILKARIMDLAAAGEKMIEHVELGTYGTLFYAIRFNTPDKLMKAAQSPGAVLMNWIARTVDLCATNAAKLYAEVGYTGLVDGCVRIENALGAPVVPLFNEDGFFWPDAPDLKKNELEPNLEWRLSLSAAELRDDSTRKDRVRSLIKDAGWSLGFKFSNDEINPHLL